MPHFYFHLCDGESITDPVGKELPDLDAVQDEAVRSARLMISADVLEGRLNLGWRFDIRDADGTLVMRFPFSDALDLSHLTSRRGRWRQVSSDRELEAALKP